MGYPWPKNNKPRYPKTSATRDCWGGCSGGKRRLHGSKEEAWYCNQLSLELKSGNFKGYSSQVRFDIHDRKGKACGWLRVDFLIEEHNGTQTVREYKGRHLENTPEFRHKRALFTWCHPDVQYITVGKGQLVI